MLLYCSGSVACTVVVSSKQKHNYYWMLLATCAHNLANFMTVISM